MTSHQYRTHLAALGLSILAAGRWLGVSSKTAQRYATVGPSPSAARAIEMAVGVMGLDRMTTEDANDYRDIHIDQIEPEYVRHSDLTAVLGLPAKSP